MNKINCNKQCTSTHVGWNISSAEVQLALVISWLGWLSLWWCLQCRDLHNARILKRSSKIQSFVYLLNNLIPAAQLFSSFFLTQFIFEISLISFQIIYALFKIQTCQIISHLHIFASILCVDLVILESYDVTNAQLFVLPANHAYIFYNVRFAVARFRILLAKFNFVVYQTRLIQVILVLIVRSEALNRYSER